jgi:hypothetical protein
MTIQGLERDFDLCSGTGIVSNTPVPIMKISFSFTYPSARREVSSSVLLIAAFIYKLDQKKRFYHKFSGEIRS